MGRLAETVKQMTVNVTSPDGNVQAKFVGGHKVTVRIRPGRYEGYSEEALSQQLGQLGRLVHTGYRRGVNEAIRKVTGEEVDNEPHWDARQRRFDEARAKIEAAAKSPGNCVRASAVGLLHWQFRIRPGTLSRLTEEQFLAEVHAVIEAVRNDNNLKVSELGDRIFGKVTAGRAARPR